MKLGMTWADLHMLSVLSKIGLPIFFVFSLLAFLRFIFSIVEYINKYFNDKTNSFNIALNYVTTYKNETIIVLCIILTLFVLFNSNIFEIKFNFKNSIIIFIYVYGLLRLFIQLFFSI
jgi:hypothetical protein